MSNPLLRLVPNSMRHQGHGLRWMTVYRQFLPAPQYAGRKLDVYWLNTGRCGSRFLYRLLETADNVAAFHDLGMLPKSRNAAARLYMTDQEAYWKMPLDRFMKAKVLEAGKYEGEVFTEIGHSLYGYGYAMWRYYQEHLKPRQVRFVHLVRNPVDCCQSILKVERDVSEGGHGWVQRAPEIVLGATPAEKAASVWNNVNEICSRQVERIAAEDPDAARVQRIEDLDTPDRVGELFDWMRLRGFDAEKITPLLSSTSFEVRHSHVTRDDVSKLVASEDDLQTIRRNTAEMASKFGYQTQATAPT